MIEKLLALTRLAAGPEEPKAAAPSKHPVILIVGSPNVGKSLLFNRLTGRYVTVSNYPGTTVEVTRGRSGDFGQRLEVVDTPGMYSLAPITEEERVASNLLLEEEAQAVIHVVDAKNIERMLGLTLQLIEAGLPVVLALNMADEARALGVRIDAAGLRKALDIPVVETVATTGEGITELAQAIQSVRLSCGVPIHYGPLEPAVAQGAERLKDVPHRLSARTRALLALQQDQGAAPQAAEHSVHYQASVALRAASDPILAKCVALPGHKPPGFAEKLSRLCMHPLAGFPLLALVLYFGLYKFVGGFGAGTVVNFLEGTIFEGYVNPAVERIVAAALPWPLLHDLIAGEYGVITLGVRYAVAIVLPIVGTFFIAFSILEDSGYLPRLAMLIDRIFKKIGLNGRAVIPLVLGLGCDTMATMVTRTLETRRERVIATVLLALAIPCSAQLGVIMGLLAGRPWALAAWALFVAGVFLAAGFLAARLLPGDKPSFYMELPPLRMPKLANVVIKTYSRVVWYFREVLPLFILASVMIWVGNVTGLFRVLVRALEPLVRLIGLPDGSAVAFLFGFFRRDYGAAGLYDLQKTGAMTGNQLAVAAITLTLFLPCVAQFLIMKKERGWKSALATAAGIFVLAFAVGFLANGLFVLTGVSL
jgi:ferrous iron transport protein B